MTSTQKMQNPITLLEQLSIEGPVDMFNQLKFRPQARYPQELAQPACTGEQAFQRYAELLQPVLPTIGGSIKIWLGRVHAELTPGNGESWDVMAVFRFPSVDALIQLFSNPDFHAVHVHREAAVANSRTFVCSSVPDSSRP